jgi:hypothetical protein
VLGPAPQEQLRKIFRVRLLHPFEQRPGIMQTHSNGRMAKQHFDEWPVGVRVRLLEDIVEISNGLMRVNEKDQVKLRQR